jgi:hypothetical protein
MDTQGWMVAYVAGSEAEAHIVAGRLLSEDIEAQVYQETFSRVTGIGIGALTAPKVLVRPEDYERAKAILDYAPEELADDNRRVIFGDDSLDE